MLVKAGSKLFVAGEYAVLKEDAYALISFIPKYTYLDIKKGLKDNIYSKIEDNDNLIQKCILYLKNRFSLDSSYILKFDTELYDENKIKYGLGSSASITIAIIKGILKIEKIFYSKKMLFDIAVDFFITNNIKGSYADLACIAFEENIIFKSSNNIKKNYKIFPLKSKFPFKIKAIWSKKESKTSLLTKNVDINHKDFILFYKNSNFLIKKIFKTKDINVINKLNNNLKFLDDKFKIGIFNNIKETLKKYKYSKISGAGGGDFILIFIKTKKFHKLKIKL